MYCSMNSNNHRLGVDVIHKLKLKQELDNHNDIICVGGNWMINKEVVQVDDDEV